MSARHSRVTIGRAGVRSRSPSGSCALTVRSIAPSSSSLSVSSPSSSSSSSEGACSCSSVASLAAKSAVVCRVGASECAVRGKRGGEKGRCAHRMADSTRRRRRPRRRCRRRGCRLYSARHCLPRRRMRGRFQRWRRRSVPTTRPSSTARRRSLRRRSRRRRRR